MKCPYCDAELQTDNEIARLILWRCHTPGCLLNGWHSAEIIQNLIAGKKAQDALKGIEIRVAAIRSCVQDGYTQLGERNRNIFIALELFKDLIKEITSITKLEQKDVE